MGAAKPDLAGSDSEPKAATLGGTMGVTEEEASLAVNSRSGREHLKGAGEMGTFGAGAGKGAGGPKSVTEFLYCHDTAGPPFWGRNVGPDIMESALHAFQGRVARRLTGGATPPWEGWAVVLPISGGINEGDRGPCKSGRRSFGGIIWSHNLLQRD